jgi:hypothetical protein
METWSISWAVRNLLSELLTPPGILIVWVLLMLFLIKKHELIKKALITIGLLMIWVTSTNYFAVQFTNLAGHWMNWPAHVSFIASNSTGMSKGNSDNPEVIVILGGGRRKGALETPSEYQQQDLSPKLHGKTQIWCKASQENEITYLGHRRRS